MQTHMPQTQGATQNETGSQDSAQETEGLSLSVGQSKASAKVSAKAADAFLTISEVSERLEVPQHVLRFWETKFTQVRPLKRGGGRRYYRPEDVAVLTHIHSLLYGEGYTIKGVQKLLKGQGKNQVANQALGAAQRKSLPQPANETQAPAMASSSSSMATPSARTQNAFHAQQKPGFSSTQKRALEGLLSDLKDLRGMFKPVK